MKERYNRRLMLVIEKYGGLVIAFFFFVNGILWSRSIPFDGAPDEYNHIAIPRFYLENGRLPVFNQDPGMGFVCRTNGVDCSESYSMYANYGYGVNAAAMTILGGSDYQKARVGMAFMGALAVLLVWELSKRVLEKDILLTVSVTAVAAFIPEFTFYGAFVNAEMPGILSSLAVLLFAWEVANRRKLTSKFLLFGGVSLSLLALSRLNYYPMFLMPVVAFVLRKRKLGLGWRGVLGQVGQLGMMVVVLSGWWFVRNWGLYGDPFGVATFWSAFWTFSTRIPAREMGIGFSGLFFGQVYGTNWLWTSFKSLIGSFGYMGIWFPEWIYKAALVIVLAGLFKTIIQGSKRLLRGEENALFWTSMGVVGVVTFFLSAWTSWVNDYQPQGRYWFVFYYPLVLGVVFGITKLLPGKPWRIISSIVLVGLVVLLNFWGRQLIVSSS